MKSVFIIIFLFFGNLIHAQNIYFDSISKVKKRTYKYKKINGEKLKLDFYTPKKIRKNYPLILYVHGGGFSGGKKDENYIKDFANYLTKRGYAVASISYRLSMKKKGFGCITKANDKIKAFKTASEDISFALQYILKKKRRFKIDREKIILAGSSAGAEAVLHFVYVNDGNWIPKNLKFAGIISMAGALISLDKINLKTVIPTQLFHGTSDKLVPFDVAPHHYCSKNDVGYLPLFGSKAIANKLKSLKKSYYLYAVKNGDHSWNSIPMYQCQKEILDFLYFDVLQQQYRQTEIIID
ncbi:alpha/beta hydrolase [Polaribacter sp.]|uniref:alpha/beta hydrolase n=1 Tax=Polaribacter sp. TaxID=1920175 RepID=UPI003F6AC085